jgi:hypothetical protein
VSRLLPVVAILLAACAGSPSRASSPENVVPVVDESADADPVSSRAPDESPTPGPSPVPTQCVSGEDECLPPAAWVHELCNGVYAEVALAMFRGGTPWQRVYLRGKTRAVNASGGASVAGHLSPQEEVLVLRHRRDDPGGMQIGDGSGQYDALRWNGSCVSLEGGEVTSHRPGQPKSSRIEWTWLGEAMQSALRRDDTVTETYRARRQECRGATTGKVSRKCQRLDEKLIDVIASYVRSGPELPEPEQRP